MQVIPPGMEFHHIVPHEGDMDGETEGTEDGKAPDPPIWTEVSIDVIFLPLQMTFHAFCILLFLLIS